MCPWGWRGRGGILMPLIELTQGQWTLVDDEDFEELAGYSWRAAYNPQTGSYYACRAVRLRGRATTQRMHRRIMGLQIGDGLQVDHINHDTLDNRRSNLRVVTSRGNNSNRRKQSIFGVGVIKRVGNVTRPFQAQVHIGGRLKHVGYFSSPEEACGARAKFLELYGSELGSI